MTKISNIALHLFSSRMANGICQLQCKINATDGKSVCENLSPLYALHHIHDRPLNFLTQISVVQFAFAVFKIGILCIFHKQRCKKAFPTKIPASACQSVLQRCKYDTTHYKSSSDHDTSRKYGSHKSLLQNMEDSVDPLSS